MHAKGEVRLADDRATVEWATRLLGPLAQRARATDEGALVTLDGPLGAGKSVVARSLLRAAGVSGPVPSPTYTLVEPYTAGGLRFLHLDVYRLSDPDELALLGVDAWRERGVIALVEWSQRLQGAFGEAQLRINLAYDGRARRLNWCWQAP